MPASAAPRAAVARAESAHRRMRRLRRALQHRIELLLVLLVRGVDRLLGRRMTEWGVTRLGRFAYRPLGIRARVVEEQLRQAFPERDEGWIRRTAAAAYGHVAREGLTLLRVSRLEREQVLALTHVDEGVDAMKEAVAAGTGAILVTGHFGNWEIGGAAIAARGIPLDVVARRQSNPLFDRLINAARERLGMRIIQRRDATRQLLRTLREGRVLALVADQDARRAGVFVPFLGRPASTFRGPAVLALRSSAPVFIGTARRRPDGHYDVRVRPIPRPSGDDPERLVLELTAAHTAALEAAVRDAPEQYFWHHRRWKTAPPAAERARSGEV